MSFAVAALAAVPACAELRFEERNGALYVTDVEPSTASTPSVAAAPSPREWRSGAPYRALIQQTAERYALAPELVEAVIRVESNFEPRAISPTGARGLMQLMPATARLLGVQDVFDAHQNIDGGVRHLRNLIDRYRGDVALALAAYNAGAEAVGRYGGIPPFAETQTYVARIMKLVGRVGPASAEAVEPPAPLRSDARTLHRYQTTDGVVVYSNVPLNRVPGTGRK